MWATEKKVSCKACEGNGPLVCLLLSALGGHDVRKTACCSCACAWEQGLLAVRPYSKATPAMVQWTSQVRVTWAWRVPVAAAVSRVGSLWGSPIELGCFEIVVVTCCCRDALCRVPRRWFAAAGRCRAVVQSIALLQTPPAAPP